MGTARILTIFALSTAFLVAGCAASYGDEAGGEEVRTQQRTVAFAEWDEDGDGVLDESEFESWWGEEDVFGEWDADDDGEIAEEELVRGLHDHWDIDDDEVIVESEWEDAVVWLGGGDPTAGVWAEEIDYGTWNDWDANDDDELDVDEVREGVVSTGLYTALDVDSDGIVDDRELRRWFFDVVDTNDDDEIDTTEWDNFGM